MKKVYKQCEVTLVSDNPMIQHRFYLGFGQIQDERHFRFEVEPQECRKKNPLIYRGKLLRVRGLKDGRLRCTAICEAPEAPKQLQVFCKTLGEEIAAACKAIEEKMTVQDARRTNDKKEAAKKVA